MKKLFLIAGVSSFALMSCGGSSEENSGSTDSTGTTTEVETPVDNSILDPMKDDLSGEIQVTDLINSMNVYYDREIQVVVYPSVYVDGEAFSEGMYATASAESTDKAASLSFTTLPTETVKKGQPYLIKGKIESVGYYGELKMKECELMELPADYTAAAFNPKSISSTAIYNVADVKGSIMAWDKKVITVVGDYYGTTVSKSADGTQLLDARVDLGTSAGDTKVGCSFATEEEATKYEAGQLGVKIKGELSYMLSWGSPVLSNCTSVN